MDSSTQTPNFSWSNDELQTMETFFNETFFPSSNPNNPCVMPTMDILSLGAATQNKNTAMGSFEKMLSHIHPRVLRDLIKVIRLEQVCSFHPRFSRQQIDFFNISESGEPTSLASTLVSDRSTWHRYFSRRSSSHSMSTWSTFNFLRKFFFFAHRSTIHLFCRSIEFSSYSLLESIEMIFNRWLITINYHSLSHLHMTSEQIRQSYGIDYRDQYFQDMNIDIKILFEFSAIHVKQPVDVCSIFSFQYSLIFLLFCR